jgi:hypothetical protein
MSEEPRGQPQEGVFCRIPECAWDGNDPCTGWVSECSEHPLDQANEDVEYELHAPPFPPGEDCHCTGLLRCVACRHEWEHHSRKYRVR